MGNLKRGYLNREEENFFMVTKAYIESINGIRNIDRKATPPIWEEWEKRGMITPSMKKNLKMANTYLNKFMHEVQLNFDIKYSQKISKKCRSFDYRLIDDYTTKKICRDTHNSLQYAIMNRDKFMDIIERVSGVECVGCTKDYKSCDLCKLYEDISLAYVGQQPNCPYAADLSEFDEKEKANYEELIKRFKTNNGVVENRKR